MEIGKAVKILRKNIGLKQFELAALIGISNNAISQIETNRVIPNKTTIKKLVEVLKVPMSLMLWLSIEDEDFGTTNKLVFNSVNKFLTILILNIQTDNFKNSNDNGSNISTEA